jgi:hypothetical protein
VNISCLAIALLLASLPSVALSETARLGESCDLASQGDHETKTFLTFDQELRNSLSRQDAGIVALLVRFPLRVNGERSSYYLSDPASLQARFSEIFPSDVKQAVLKQSPEKLFCNAMGVMYGNGVIWVTRVNRRYAISTINLPGRNIRQANEYRVEFACQTDKYRFVIDKTNSGILQYRAWNSPHSLREEPDTKLSNGKKDIEGTGLCAHPVWTFSGSASNVVVEGLGCSEDKPPEGAVGTLQIGTKDDPGISAWCF